MAGAYKCDICGALFAERPSIEQDVTWYLAQTVDRGYERPADMCKVCLDNLQLWVKNKGRCTNVHDRYKVVYKPKDFLRQR